MNQRRCCANESGSVPSRGTGTRGGAALPGPAAGRPQRLLDPRRELRQRRRLEEVAQRQLDAERPAQPREHPRRQQRVAAQLEEPVGDPRPVRGRAPRPRCRRGPPRPASAAPGSRPRSACRSGAGRAFLSTLPLGVSGSRSSSHEGRRHHVFRQPLAQAGRAGRGASPRARPSPAPDRRPDAGHRRRPRARRPPPPRGPRAEPPSAASISPSSMRKPRIFTWVSRRALEIDRAVRQVAPEIAGPVQAVVRRAGERVGDEALAGQRLVVEIAEGEIGRADADLSQLAHPGELIRGVEHQELDPVDPPAERDPLAVRQRRPRGSPCPAASRWRRSS